MDLAETSDKSVLCSNCEESNSIENLYKCAPCNKMDGNEKPVDTGSVEYLCDICIASHVKKGHSVLDHRNLQPTICTEHKMICLEYCITCDELFCGKCLTKHRFHTSKSMAEMASEVRSKIFNLLTVWESNEKTALEKHESVSAFVNQHESEVETLVKQVEDRIDKLKEKVIAEIRAKLAEFKKSESRFEDHIQKVGQTQKELRGLLSMSDGSMIESFRTLETSLDSLGGDHRAIEVYEMNTNAFGTTEGFDALNEKLVRQVVRNLKLPGVEREHQIVPPFGNFKDAFKFGLESTGQSSSFKFGVSTAAPNTEQKPTVSDRANYDENIFQSKDVYVHNATTKRSTEQTTASTFASIKKSKDPFRETGFESGLFVKQASPQTAAGNLCGKGEAKMQRVGSLFARPKSDDMQTANDSFALKFGLQPGQWSCGVCFIRNNADAVKCAACQTHKDGKAVPGRGGTETLPDLRGASEGTLFTVGIAESSLSGTFRDAATNAGTSKQPDQTATTSKSSISNRSRRTATPKPGDGSCRLYPRKW